MWDSCFVCMRVRIKGRLSFRQSNDSLTVGARLECIVFLSGFGYLTCTFFK